MKITFTGNEGHRDENGGVVYGITARNVFRSQSVTVNSGSATELPATPLSNRLSFIVYNNSTGGQTVYLGGSDVSSSNGLPIAPRASLSIAGESDAHLYAISSADGADIRILEGG